MDGKNTDLERGGRHSGEVKDWELDWGRFIEWI